MIFLPRPNSRKISILTALPKRVAEGSLHAPRSVGCMYPLCHNQPPLKKIWGFLVNSLGNLTRIYLRDVGGKSLQWSIPVSINVLLIIFLLGLTFSGFFFCLFYLLLQIDLADILKETKQFTYKDGDQFVFMDLVSSGNWNPYYII